MMQKDGSSVRIFGKKYIFHSFNLKLKTVFIGAILVLISTSVFSQHGGNAVIGQSYNYNKTSGLQSVDKLYLSDTSFIIQANVLNNVIADSYVAIFGVSESSNTLVDANSKIDRRINNFISALMKIRISKEDIYVDMTTQTLISDYKVTGNYAEQFISGFEQKKMLLSNLKISTYLIK